MLSFDGAPVDPQTVIALSTGWNWISYLPQGSLSIGDALVNLAASEGDKIKTLGPYADYYEGFGWFGSLEFLNPGTGYLPWKYDPNRFA